MPAPSPPAATPARKRIESVDLVRGIIMIVMALDHTRDYFGVPGQNPVDLSKASAALFLTRWITNICAPVFFLLTGTGAYLALRRRSRVELSQFLLTRGLWLIFVEVIVMRCLSYQFNFDYHVTILLVLWALGWSMIVLALLVRFPTIVATVFGIVLIAAHNLLDGVQTRNPLWVILHAPGFVLQTPTHVVFAAYPLIPWIGVTAVGFSLGQLYAWDADRRRAWMLRGGIALTAAFLVLRYINVYGDPARWMTQKSPLFTALSFLNVVKYPPSLLFLLMTLGPALILLGLADRRTLRALEPALIIGKVPMFYYVLHFTLIHLLAVATCLVCYGSAHWMTESPDLGNYPFSAPPGWGYSLPVVYLVWALVVIAMYPLCRWFAAVKQRRSDWWLSYL
ncbi:MAG: heparan-alpha-glucosaminide N-acetyltransferase domain-containing protein [Gemmatimonadota bacterium]|nr:heparan-alpha-glucosaminide N-acetyltransferase domain-containing protein [Gemmatimonadota bacterium]